MSDNLEFLPKPENSLELLAVKPTSDSDQEKPVTVELPVDVLAALDQYGHRSGQTQSQSQSILDALRSALGLVQTSDQTSPASTHAERSAADADDSETTPSKTATEDTLDALRAEIEHLKRRLHLLEPLISKVEDLAGKSIAF